MSTAISKVAYDAARCGMSYGKYVSGHSDLPAECVKPHKDEILITCPRCGKKFYRPIYTPAKHCKRLCDECRKEAYIQREQNKREKLLGCAE